MCLIKVICWHKFFHMLSQNNTKIKIKHCSITQEAFMIWALVISPGGGGGGGGGNKTLFSHAKFLVVSNLSPPLFSLLGKPLPQLSA